MSYGFEVNDENGNPIFDSDMLKQRVFWNRQINSPGNYYYNESFEKRPTVFVSAVNSPVPMIWEHITSNGNFVGIKLIETDETTTTSNLLIVLIQ